MDENNGCMAGCGAFMVLGCAAALTLVGAIIGTDTSARNLTPEDREAANALFAVVIVLMLLAIAMAKKARIT